MTQSFLPPLAPYPEDDLLSELAAEVSAELASLVGTSALISGAGRSAPGAGDGAAGADGSDAAGRGSAGPAGAAAAGAGAVGARADGDEDLLRPLAQAIVELDLDHHRGPARELEVGLEPRPGKEPR